MGSVSAASSSAMSKLQGEQSTWAKLSAIESNCGIEVCLDQCLRELELQGRQARQEEARQRYMSGLPPSKVAEEGAAATGEAEGEHAICPSSATTVVIVLKLLHFPALVPLLWHKIFPTRLFGLGQKQWLMSACHVVWILEMGLLSA